MKIYTKKGDQGKTSICGSEKISKSSIQVTTWGDLDELNAHIGFVISISKSKKINNILNKIQKDIFTIGAICLNRTIGESEKSKTESVNPVCYKSQDRQISSQFNERNIHYLEDRIDEISALLKPINRFILPSGSKTTTSIHIARTICRRAERTLVALIDHKAGAKENQVAQTEIQKTVIPYLNRLSDLLFVLARYANKGKDIFV